MKCASLLLALLTTTNLVAQRVEDIWFELGGSGTRGGISIDCRTPGPPNVVLDAQGHPIVSWYTYGGNLAFHRWNGLTWETMASEVRVEVSDWTIAPPALALELHGRLHLAWLGANRLIPQVYCGRWDGSRWIGSGRHSAWAGGISANSGVSMMPSLTLDSLGHPIVAWSDGSSGQSQIYVRRFDGTAWVELGENSARWEGISSSTGSRAEEPSLALESSGHPMVAWADDSSGVMQIYLRRWDGEAWVEVGAGSASGEGVSRSPVRARNPSLAIGPDDRPVVAWREFTGIGTWAIYVRRWDGTSWEDLGGSATGAGISAPSSNAYTPSVSVGPDGEPIVAWVQAFGWSSDKAVHIRRWDGEAWVELGEGSASDMGIAFGPYRYSASGSRMAIDSLGRPVVVWRRDYPSTIYLRTTGPGLYMPGDANGDRVVDAADLVTITNHIDGGQKITDRFLLMGADLNPDDVIDEADAAALLDRLLGID